MLPVSATFTSKTGESQEALIIDITYDDIGPIVTLIDEKGKLKLARFENLSNCHLRAITAK